MLSIEPWQHVPAARMAVLYDAAREAWRRDLAWDTAATWPAVEAARLDGRAGGVVVHDGATLAGWTYWVVRGSELHCGALVGASAEVTGVLVDAVMEAAGARAAGRVVLFTCPPAPGVSQALEARGFLLDPYDYFVRPLGAPVTMPAASGSVRPWDLRDLDATADLFGASYPPDARRPFAGQGSDLEWRAYTRDLVLTDGCGRFRLSVSRAASGAGRLDGVALVTDLGVGTAHLAQLAVRPEARGRGLARRLLTEVADGATRAGFARLSLLVSGANTGARALYLDAGFAPQAGFLAATLPLAAFSRADRRATPAPVGA